MFLNELNAGERVEGYYLLQNAFSKQSANGKPYLSVVLQDRSGLMDGKVWDYAGPVSPADIGAVIKLRGTVSEYRGALQMTVERLRLAEEGDPYRVEELVPSAPLDADGAWAELRALAESITDGDYAALSRELLERYGEALRRIPAAKSVHHGFLHGLLMHTLSMLKTADFLAGLYGEVIDRSLLLCGTLAHDLAKSEEFVFSPLGLVTDYSLRGQLLGHLVMGAQSAAEAAARLGVPEEKSVLLQHMILSHHGEPQFGAAVVPQCAESELLAYIDRIDSRMEIYRETLPEVPVGEFSQKIFSLEHKIYRHG